MPSNKNSERTPALPNGMFNWYKSFFHLPDVYALQHQSLDAYLFLRFLRMTVIVTFVGCVITWPVLFPVNATGGGGQSQLDILSYSNVDASTFKKRHRYFAHLFISWIYYIFVMYLIFREFIFYINLRQAFLLSPLYAQRLSSRTVLFTSVPDSIRDERRIRKIFGAAVRNVWVIRDTKELDENVKNRDKAAFRLEKSEVKLIKKANKARTKGLNDANDGEPKENPGALEAASGEVAARYITPKDRPTHKLGLLGLIGKKVDSIDWCREELGRLSPLIQKQQAEYDNQKPTGSVFVEFATQAQAENAFQSLAHHEGLHMARFIGITPSDVVWSSLNLPWWQRAVRRYAVLAFITALVIFWAIPVAVVGLISNVNYLEKISFLTWLQKVPTIIMGFITGLLPSVALSILMSLVPVIMRLCARLSGEPSISRVELFTQNAYFCFQVIQVFLVTTLASAATAVVKQIVDNPSDATSLLANNLPKASNFYMSYIIVQGMQVAASVISQVVGFFIFHLMYKYITGTPRGLYEKWSNLSAISWGSTLPVYTNIAVIAITYCAIAPLVLGFACIGMSFFYFAYRYNVLFVTNTNIDTRGLIYPRALKQLMVGVYLSQVCMIGLYGASVAIIQLVLQIIFLVFTVLFHISVVNSLDPLLYNMPRSLLAEEESRQTAAAVASSSSAPGGPAGAGAPADQPADGIPDVLESNGSYTGAITTRPDDGGPFKRFAKPWVYDNYLEMRALVPAHGLNANYATQYTPDIERKAYLPPSASAEAPLLWIPRDIAGVSRQEISHTKHIEMTDAGCDLTEDGKIEWDRENLRPPIWQQEIVY